MSRSDWYIRANLKLRHLQLLVALDEMRSVSRVAAALSLTQPAVSKMLSSLESGMGLRIFERTPAGLAPTEHGVCLIRHAHDILARLNMVQSDLRDISEVPVIRVSLGVMPAAALKLGPQLIELLESQTQDVAVSVQEGTMESLLPALRAGSIDFLVGVLPNRPLGAEFSYEVFYEDPFVIAVRCGHPLARKDSVDWSDLQGLPMILPPQGALTRELIISILANHQINIPRRIIESVSIMTIVGVLQNRDIFGLLPLEMAQYFAALGVLSTLPLPVPDAHRNVGIMWRTDVQSSTTHNRVLQIFRGAYPKTASS